jgi:hypothetical protein
MEAFEHNKLTGKDTDGLDVLERVAIEELESPLFGGIVASVGEGRSKEKRGGVLERQLEVLSESLEEYGQTAW